VTESGRALVGVITPVHNGEGHIGRCVESVLGQTYSSWVYTIVNNGSTDRTAEIVASYAQRDPRITVLHAGAQSSPAAALNAALRRLPDQAAYGKIVLADDWIAPSCLERMVDLATAHPRVALVSAYMLDGSWVGNEGLPYPSTVVPGREVARRSLLQRLSVFGSPTSVLWRADVLRQHDPFYDEGTALAHSEACFEAVRDGDFGFVHQVLTFSPPEDEGARRASRAVLHDVSAVERFGFAFLTSDELRSASREAWNAYYAFLGSSLLRRRGRAFWDEQRRELRRLGKTIRPTRVLWGIPRAVRDLLRAGSLWRAVRGALIPTRG
jgi:glycosyltransferase involved in cell wall biosynthesis